MIETEVLKEIWGFAGVALSIIIALYAIVMDKVEDLIERRVNELKRLRPKRDQTLERLNKDKENEEIAEKYNSIIKQINDLISVPYQYNWGYMFSGILFALVLIFSFIEVYIMRLESTSWEPFVIYAPYFLLIGLINFVYVWFRTMIDLRNLTLTKFDEIESEEILQEEKIAEKKIRSKKK
jgi:hypothetical protein